MRILEKTAITSTIDNFETARAALERHGLDAVHFATIEAVPLDFIIPDINYDWVVFTSKNAVTRFLQKAGQGCFKGKKIGSIGGETSAVLEKYGIKSDFIPSEFNSGVFIREAGLSHDFSGKKVLLPCSAISGKNIADGLGALGACTDRIFVYDTVKPKKSAAEIKEFFENKPYLAIFFSSPSSFRNYLEITVENGREALKESTPIAIGAQTADTIKAAGFDNVITAEKSSFESMADAAVKIKT